MTTDSTSPMPSFDGMANMFVTAGALISPAELHGLLCGQLSGGNRFDEQRWLQVAEEFLDAPKELDAGANRLLGECYRATLAQLEGSDFVIDLLLPDDDNELSQRITALSQWCHGFLSGFGSSGISGNTQLSAETADVLRDFAAFVQLDPDDQEDEESEADYMEVLEYVRVATLTVFMETGAKAPPANDSTGGPTVH